MRSRVKQGYSANWRKFWGLVEHSVYGLRITCGEMSTHQYWGVSACDRSWPLSPTSEDLCEIQYIREATVCGRRGGVVREWVHTSGGKPACVDNLGSKISLSLQVCGLLHNAECTPEWREGERGKEGGRKREGRWSYYSFLPPSMTCWNTFWKGFIFPYTQWTILSELYTRVQFAEKGPLLPISLGKGLRIAWEWG